MADSFSVTEPRAVATGSNKEYPKKIPLAPVRGYVAYTRRRCESSEIESGAEGDFSVTGAAAASKSAAGAAKETEVPAEPKRLAEQRRRKIAIRRSQIHVIEQVLEIHGKRQGVFRRGASASSAHHHIAAATMIPTSAGALSATATAVDHWAAASAHSTTFAALSSFGGSLLAALL